MERRDWSDSFVYVTINNTNQLTSDRPVKVVHLRNKFQGYIGE